MSLPQINPLSENADYLRWERIIKLEQYYSRPMPEKRGPVKVEFRKMMYDVDVEGFEKLEDGTYVELD